MIIEFSTITSAISKVAPQASQLLIKHAQRNEACNQSFTGIKTQSNRNS
ncbi:MAG: hypothetical protein RLZZ507_367 [Cyanobacteriota bacterium]|jgi:hypothetical protein